MQEMAWHTIRFINQTCPWRSRSHLCDSFNQRNYYLGDITCKLRKCDRNYSTLLINNRTGQRTDYFNIHRSKSCESNMQLSKFYRCFLRFDTERGNEICKIFGDQLTAEGSRSKIFHRYLKKTPLITSASAHDTTPFIAMMFGVSSSKTMQST